jgi:serine/threonine-protein kinase
LDSFPIKFGRYELLGLVARGGMAEVFRARLVGQQGTTSKLIAVKRILPNYSSDPDFIRLFEKEIGLAMSLGHPNLVTIYDFGMVQDQHYMAMEYVNGKSLDVVVKECNKRGIPLPLEFCCYIVRETCNALAYAHELRDSVSGKWAGIIHRDISPHNLMLSYTGTVKLFDFGVAKLAAREKSTMAVIKGKPAYLSPEQARGEELDGRTDIFSLGIVLWEALTGQRLFYADQAMVAIRQVSEKEILPPSKVNPRMKIPTSLDTITMRALARDLEQRYATARDFASDINFALRSLQHDYGEVQAADFLNSIFLTEAESDKKELTDMLSMPSLPTGEIGAESPAAEEPRPSLYAELRVESESPTKPTVLAKRASTFASTFWEWAKAAACIGIGMGLQYLHPVETFFGAESASRVSPVPYVPAPRLPASHETKSSPVPSTTQAISYVPSAAALSGECDAQSPPVCALQNGSPHDFSNSCAATAGKALLLYKSKCEARLNPDATIRETRLSGGGWRKGKEHARVAVPGDRIEISVERSNFPAFLQLRVSLVSTSPRREVAFENVDAPSVVLVLPLKLARGQYQLELTAEDGKGNVVFMKKEGSPFLYGLAEDLATATIDLGRGANYKRGSVSPEAIQDAVNQAALRQRTVDLEENRKAAAAQGIDFDEVERNKKETRSPAKLSP